MMFRLFLGETLRWVLALVTLIGGDVVSVGCIGMCSNEPLVDIQQAGCPRITYRNVHPDMVPRLIEEHLVKGDVVQEWVMGRLPDQGIGQ